MRMCIIVGQGKPRIKIREPAFVLVLPFAAHTTDNMYDWLYCLFHLVYDRDLARVTITISRVVLLIISF
jgi:hypothetical protein